MPQHYKYVESIGGPDAPRDMDWLLRWTIPVPYSGCYLWLGAVSQGDYGSVNDGTGTQPAHRVAYKLANGPIPAGMEIDHLCRVHCCVNPAHLEAVTNRENKMRGLRRIKPVCKRGHEMSGTNITYDPLGRRKGCRECNRLSSAAHYAKRRTPR